MGSAAYEKIKSRMGAIGIKLDEHVQGETNSWYNGFRFIPKDMKKLVLDLIAAGQFCADSGVAARFQGVGTLSLRQLGVGGMPGMHVLIKKGEPYKGYGIVEYCEIHIDSISPAAGAGDGGKCYYHPDLLADHYITDQKHLPLIVPGREGFRLGFRF